MLDYRIPELRTEPDDEFYIVAGCGHEVYNGEKLYSFNGQVICPDCMEEKINELNIWEIASAFGYEVEDIRKPDDWAKIPRWAKEMRCE